MHVNLAVPLPTMNDRHNNHNLTSTHGTWRIWRLQCSTMYTVMKWLQILHATHVVYNQQDVCTKQSLKQPWLPAVDSRDGFITCHFTGIHVSAVI